MGFFKVNNNKTPKKAALVEQAKPIEETPFQKLFKPFHVNTNVVLHPQTRFTNHIVIDFEMPEHGMETNPELLATEFKEFYSYANHPRGHSLTPVRILNMPEDIPASKWKLLQFGENYRPAYFGFFHFYSRLMVKNNEEN